MAAPLILFHGTPYEFDAIEVGRSSTNYGFLGMHDVKVRRFGVFLTPEIGFAREFAGAGGRVLSAVLRTPTVLDLREGFPETFFRRYREMLKDNNIAEIDIHWMWELFDEGFPGAKEFVEAVKQEGYDCVCICERCARSIQVNNHFVRSAPRDEATTSGCTTARVNRRQIYEKTRRVLEQFWPIQGGGPDR